MSQPSSFQSPEQPSSGMSSGMPGQGGAGLDLPPSMVGTMQFGEVFYILRDKIWLLSLCMLAAVLLGLAYAARQPKVFTSRSVLQVELDQQIVNIQDPAKQDQRSFEGQNTMVEIMRGAPFLTRVSKALQLGSDPDFLGEQSRGQQISDEVVGSMLSGMVKPTIRKSTRLIDVFVEHGNPRVCQITADAVAREFIKFNVEQRSGTSEGAIGFLFEQFEKFKKQLAESEVALQAYREANKEALLDEAEVRDMNVRVTNARTVRMMIESDLKEIRRNGTDPKFLLTLASIQNDLTVGILRDQASRHQAEMAALAQRYTEQHPAMIKARAQLQQLEEDLNRAAVKASDQLNARYESSMAQEKQFEVEALNKNKAAIQYKVLLREVESNRDLYNSIVKRLKETDITKQLDVSPVRLVETAFLPGEPIRPNKRKIMMAAVAGGLLVGISLAFILHYMDSSLRAVQQVEDVLRLPALGAIPESRIKIKTGEGIDLEKLTPVAREAFRTTLVNLSFLGKPEERKMMLFTSALPEEGKSFCSFYTAAMLAAQGHRTLLIDADLRRPSLHVLAHGGSRGPGLSDLVTGQCSEEKAIFKTSLMNLFFLASGTSAPNPPQLITSSGFAELIEQLKRNFDFIVMDSAPVNAVADTLLLARYAQKIGLIVRAGKTSRGAVLYCLNQLRKVNAEVNGVILNRMSGRGGGGYYYYYYRPYYHYYYAYGDGEKEKKRKKKS